MSKGSAAKKRKSLIEVTSVAFNSNEGGRTFDSVEFVYSDGRHRWKLLAIMPYNGHDGCVAECYVVTKEGSPRDWSGAQFEHELWTHIQAERKSSMPKRESPFEVTMFEVKRVKVRS